MAIKWGGRGFGHTSRRALAAVAAASQPVSAVDATGWQATMPTPVDLAFSSVTGTRQGFTSTGSTTTVSGTWLTTKRVRQPYPNQASLTTDTVALDEYVYSTDTLPGVTNSSAETSPKPVANWVMTDRRIVGNSLTLELCAFHRNASGGDMGIACVEFRATDGSNTVTSVVSAATVLGGTGDVHPVIGYTATLDITSLSAGTITANAKVYPKIGAAASIQDSNDNANLWDFSPRTFVKNTSLASSPNIVYVAAGGNDTTGAVSTNDATAAASPCLTLAGAIARARTVLGTGAGSLNGLRVRLTAGTWSFGSVPTANTVTAEIVIEPGTGLTKADVTYNFGAVAGHSNCTYVRYRDLTIVRAGVNPIHNVGGGGCVVENCSHDNIGNTSATVAGAGGCLLSFVNCTMTNMLSSATNPSATQIVRLVRGVTFTANGTSTNVICEQRVMVGCSMKGSIPDNTINRAVNNVILAFNRFQGGNLGTGLVDISSPSTCANIAIVQNIFEFTSASNALGFGPSADDKTANITHMVVWHNTFAGFDSYGRGNILYNETAATPRTHKLCSFVGNIHVQINTKHDVFHLDGAYVGAWSYLYGVGCRGEFSRYRDGGTGSFKQDYPGIGASIGTSNTSPGNDPLFTTPAHTTSGPVAGAGNGVYTLQVGSPARNFVTNSPLPFDLAGTARSGMVAAGAYV